MGPAPRFARQPECQYQFMSVMARLKPFCAALIDVIWETKSLVEELAEMMDMHSRMLLPHSQYARIMEACVKMCSFSWILSGDMYAVCIFVLRHVVVALGNMGTGVLEQWNQIVRRVCQQMWEWIAGKTGCGPAKGEDDHQNGKLHRLFIVREVCILCCAESADPFRQVDRWHGTENARRLLDLCATGWELLPTGTGTS